MTESSHKESEDRSENFWLIFLEKNMAENNTGISGDFLFLWMPCKYDKE